MLSNGEGTTVAPKLLPQVLALVRRSRDGSIQWEIGCLRLALLPVNTQTRHRSIADFTESSEQDPLNEYTKLNDVAKCAVF